MRFELPTIRIRSINLKLFCFIVAVLAVYLFLFYVCYEVFFPRKEPIKVNLSYVIVHIDLKGAPPKLGYLNFLLPILKDNGVNGLLMEYEDMFPYHGRLGNLSSRNCYDQGNLRKFLMEAVRLGFEIIPLIQTFGHLEFVLKLQEFKHLREVPAYPDSICPSNVESKILLKEMLKQVVNFHNSVKPLKYIHVGCDEVFHMNQCERCRKKGLPNEALFVDHLLHLSEYISDLSPGTTILIWDDMLRNLNQTKWKNIHRLNNIEPVYWNYMAQFGNGVMPSAHLSFLNYHRKFENIWAASAFKGASGATATIPNLTSRLMNHFNWMKLLANLKIAGEKKVFDFKGIILTGWSRYSHMSPICELLPVSMPSLILNLRIIKKFRAGIDADEHDDLKDIYEFYSKHLTAADNDFRCDLILNKDVVNSVSCFFEGNELYFILAQYINLMDGIMVYMHQKREFFSAAEYYSFSKYCNFNEVLIETDKCNNTLQKIYDVEAKMSAVMKKYFNDDVVNEYVPFKTFYVKKELTHIFKVLQSYLDSSRVWDRRRVSNFTQI